MVTSVSYVLLILPFLDTDAIFLCDFVPRTNGIDGKPFECKFLHSGCFRLFGAYKLVCFTQLSSVR